MRRERKNDKAKTTRREAAKEKTRRRNHGMKIQQEEETKVQ